MLCRFCMNYEAIFDKLEAAWIMVMCEGMLGQDSSLYPDVQDIETIQTFCAQQRELWGKFGFLCSMMTSMEVQSQQNIDLLRCTRLSITSMRH